MNLFQEDEGSRRREVSLSGVIGNYFLRVRVTGVSWKKKLRMFAEIGTPWDWSQGHPWAPEHFRAFTPGCLEADSRNTLPLK